MSDRRGEQKFLLKYGMHVVDAHDQVIGTILLVRKDHFVFRQDVGINQLISLPTVSVAGVVSGLVFLNLTPGEIQMFGRVLERRQRSQPEPQLRRRVAVPLLSPEPAI